MPIRLAFTHISRQSWAGGYNYLANLFVSLDAYQNGKFVPVVFAGMDADEAELVGLARLRSVEIVRSAAFNQSRVRLMQAVLWGQDCAAADAFKQSGIDVVIETARFFGWRLSFPTVAWIPDLQHRRLPHLFGLITRLRRELGFRMQIASGRTIMLSSEDARRDFEHFYPSQECKVQVVHFATLPPADLIAMEPVEVIASYNLPQCFFYLPNQFYRHKNHQIVIDALDLLKRRGVDILVVSSGAENPKEPGYFSDLMTQIRHRGLEGHFRSLGMIPFTHVYALLRSSVALINPSSFEGWSTTVEEAKSFGTPLILSDIGVHREQAHGDTYFFGLDDAATLADHLHRIAKAFKPSAPRALQPDSARRAAAFASDFIATIESAQARL